MPYNIAGNQIQVSPVTNFLQGRAMRVAEDMRRQQMEISQANMLMRQKEMQMAEQQQQLGIVANAYDMAGSAAVAKYQAYQTVFDSTKDEQAALSAAQKVASDHADFFETMFGELTNGSAAITQTARQMRKVDMETIEAEAFRAADSDQRTRLFGSSAPERQVPFYVNGEIVDFADPNSRKGRQLRESGAFFVPHGTPASLTNLQIAAEEGDFTEEEYARSLRIMAGLESPAMTARMTADGGGGLEIVGQDASGNATTTQVASLEDRAQAASTMSFAESMGSTGMDVLQSEYTTARDAYQTMGVVDQANSLLDSGIRSGTGAEIRQSIGKAFDTLLGRETDENSLTANTDAYLANNGAWVGQAIQAFGSGQGLSDKDMEFAKAMVAGEIALTEGTMRSVLDIYKRRQEWVIGAYNDRIDRFKGAGQQFTDIELWFPRLGGYSNESPQTQPTAVNPYESLSDQELQDRFRRGSQGLGGP